MSPTRQPQSKISYVSYAAAVRRGLTKLKETKQSAKTAPASARQSGPLNSNASCATVVKEGSANNSKEGSQRRYAFVARIFSKIARKPAPTNVISSIQPSIYKLPDELLMLIFESVYTLDIEGLDFAVWIAQVSRRFRAVAFATSRLWSTVSPTQGPDELGKFLERSGAARLTILIHIRCGERLSRLDDKGQFFAVLRPYYGIKWKFDDNHVVYNMICRYHRWHWPESEKREWNIKGEEIKFFRKEVTAWGDHRFSTGIGFE